MNWKRVPVVMSVTECRSRHSLCRYLIVWLEKQELPLLLCLRQLQEARYLLEAP